MANGKGEPYPHEKRVLRYAYAFTAIAAALGLVQSLSGDGRLLGIAFPILAVAGVVVLGAIVSAIAIVRRSAPLVFAGAAIMVLGVLPGGEGRPSVLTYAMGVLFGVSVLVMGELVHMTERYERAHQAVEKENVPEEHINRVTDEALKTLATRSAIAGAGVLAAIGLAYVLRSIGPRQWRDAVETTAPLGVAVAGLVLAGAVSLLILGRGTKFRGKAEPKEMLPDVAE